MAKPKYGKWLEKDTLILIEGWARAGLTLDQISHNMGISRETLNVWRKKHPVISDALSRGKEVADFEVENALYKNAMGFYYEEDTVTNYGEVITVKKYSKPHTTAQIYWLNNRKPKEWRSKRETEITGKDGDKLEVNIKL